MQIRNFFTSEDADMVDFVNSLPLDAYFLECNGRLCEDIESIDNGELISIHFRICGGKGGFGSLLRSFRIHKSHNQLMCRNLQGRRLADVKEEERLKKWVGKKAQREKEKEQKEKEKIEKLKSGSKIKHEFEDREYLRRRDTVLDEVEDAIEAGMKALGGTEIESQTLEQHEPMDSPEEGVKMPMVEEGEEQQASTSNARQHESESSSDSDLDLDELMSAGPLKKKTKKG